MKIAKIIVYDEVNVRVTGLEGEHLKDLYNTYGILTDNHFFSPKYKLGSWDGKIRYFKMDGTTYYHLLDEIMPKLVHWGYTVQFADNRTGTYVTPPTVTKDFFSECVWPDSEEPVVLYDHQLRVANSLMENGCGIAIAATGAGKTLCCAAICQSYNRLGMNAIVIVPSQDLIEQTKSDFEWLKIDTGEYSGSNKDLAHATIISTWQALKNNPTILNNMQCVIIDEAHGLTGEVLRDMLFTTGNRIVHRYGVTGTLPKGKTDELSVKLAVGPVRTIVPAKELIDLGILAKLDIHIKQLEEDFKDKYNDHCELMKDLNKRPQTYIQFKDSYFPEYGAEKEYLSTNKDRMLYTAQLIEDTSKQGNTFVLVDGVSYGRKLAELIPDAVFIHGKDKVKARKQIYNLFKTQNNLVVIATVNIASTGINIKRIYNLFLIDLGKSFTRVVQSIGRGLRVAVDKDHVDVFDICSDLKYSRKHSLERVKYYKEAEYPHSKKTINYKGIINANFR